MARSSTAIGGGGRPRRYPPAPRSSRGSHPPTMNRRSRREEPVEVKEDRSVKGRFMKEGRNFLFDFMAAVIVLLIMIGALYTYTGNWPPLVVVQSGSMEHSDAESSIGVIDTGDLVFVKKMGDDPIIPYYDGVSKDHRTYSSYGDVIIFRPNGNYDRTAIIHRAVLYIEFNDTYYDQGNFTGGSYDIPSMGMFGERYSVTIEDYEWPAKKDLIINLGSILSSFADNLKHPHSGYITKGDNNQEIDQTSPFPNQPWMEPVEKDWVIGKSVGELPWFGIIKLWMEGKENWHPNSQKNLYIALIVVVVSPFVIDFGIHLVSRTMRKDEDEPEEDSHVSSDKKRNSERYRDPNLRHRRGPRGPTGPPRR